MLKVQRSGVNPRAFLRVVSKLSAATLGRSAAAVAVAVAMHADATGTTWASVGTLARSAGVSERTVQRWLPQLERVGLLEVERRRRADGGGQTSVLRLSSVFELPEAWSEVGERHPSPRCPPIAQAPISRATVSGGGDSVSPKDSSGALPHTPEQKDARAEASARDPQRRAEQSRANAEAWRAGRYVPPDVQAERAEAARAPKPSRRTMDLCAAILSHAEGARMARAALTALAEVRQSRAGTVSRADRDEARRAELRSQAERLQREEL